MDVRQSSSSSGVLARANLRSPLGAGFAPLHRGAVVLICPGEETSAASEYCAGDVASPPRAAGRRGLLHVRPASSLSCRRHAREQFRLNRARRIVFWNGCLP